MRLLLALVALLTLSGACRAADSWPLESWSPPFDYHGVASAISYQPLDKAKRSWRICASYPHLKDSYWLSVNYGMVRHARELGVQLEIVEAGGYLNLDRQISQISDCAKTADALIVGTVSYDGLTPLLVQLSKRMPVIAAVNDIDSAGITAKSGVSWISMGEAIGAYFAKLHPKGSPKVRVAWFPGPKGAGWVGFVEQGFERGLAGSSAEIVSVKWGDTGFEDQLLLLEDLLDSADPYLRVDVVRALADLGDPKARGALQRQLDRDLDGRVRRRIREVAKCSTFPTVRPKPPLCRRRRRCRSAWWHLTSKTSTASATITGVSSGSR